MTDIFVGNSWVSVFVIDMKYWIFSSSTDCVCCPKSSSSDTHFWTDERKRRATNDLNPTTKSPRRRASDSEEQTQRHATEGEDVPLLV